MKILIFGGGGFAKEIIDLIEENKIGDVIGIVDKVKSKEIILGKRNLGTDQELDKILKVKKPTHFFVAIGDPKIREKIYLKVKTKLKPISIISKKAHVSKHTKIGDHCVVYPLATVSTEVIIADNVFIYSNSFIGHESKIGTSSNINPGANIAGKVKIGERVIVGIGSSIKENINVANDTIIGGGAMVVANTKRNTTYIGVPAKPLKKVN